MGGHEPPMILRWVTHGSSMGYRGQRVGFRVAPMGRLFGSHEFIWKSPEIYLNVFGIYDHNVYL